MGSLSSRNYISNSGKSNFLINSLLFINISSSNDSLITTLQISDLLISTLVSAILIYMIIFYILPNFNYIITFLNYNNRC